MLQQGIIERVHSSEKNQVISKFFPWPKPDGSSRFMLNLKPLNMLTDKIKLRSIVLELLLN